MTSKQQQMAALIKRLRKFDKAKRPHGALLKEREELATAMETESPTAYHHWLRTGHIPHYSYRAEALDKFLTQKGY